MFRFVATYVKRHRYLVCDRITPTPSPSPLAMAALPYSKASVATTGFPSRTPVTTMQQVNLMSKLSTMIATAVFVLAAHAQDSAASKTPPTPGQVYLSVWNDIGRKLITMAEEFPEDKYDFKPTAEVRTFAEQLLHAAASNVYVAKIARGEKIDFPELKRADYPTKASIVALLKQSVADGAAPLKANGEEQARKRPSLWVGFLEHAGEHYGQLVVYYRISGLVPPESRPKPGSSQ